MPSHSHNENTIHGIIKLVKPQHKETPVYRSGGGVEHTQLEKATSVRPGSGLRPKSMGGDTVHPDIYKSLVEQAVPQAQAQAPGALPTPPPNPMAPQGPPSSQMPEQPSSMPPPPGQQGAGEPPQLTPAMKHILEKFIDELGPEKGILAFAQKFGGQPG